MKSEGDNMLPEDMKYISDLIFDILCSDDKFIECIKSLEDNLAFNHKTNSLGVCIKIKEMKEMEDMCDDCSGKQSELFELDDLNNKKMTIDDYDSSQFNQDEWLRKNKIKW